jgi:hypothetical protein
LGGKISIEPRIFPHAAQYVVARLVGDEPCGIAFSDIDGGALELYSYPMMDVKRHILHLALNLSGAVVSS